jgi:hypothetical protein
MYDRLYCELKPEACNGPDMHVCCVAVSSQSSLELGKWEERQPKIQSFFGPGIIAQISKVMRRERVSSELASCNHLAAEHSCNIWTDAVAELLCQIV